MNANKQDAGGLLPCPGCGKSDLDHCPADFVAVNGLTRGMIVRCAWCHFAAPEAAWNRRELCRAAPGGGDDLRLLVKELRETALRSVNLRDGQGMQDAYNDCADRLESAINELGVVRDNERQPQGTTSGGSPDYSRITPADELCQKCHGTLEVLTNHAEPWSASAYSPCPDCHPAGKKGSAPAEHGEEKFQRSSGCVFCDLDVDHDPDACSVEIETVADDLERLGKEDGWLCASVGAALLRKLQQGADGWIAASERLPERIEGTAHSADVLVSDGKRVWIHCAYFDWKACERDYWGDTPYVPRLGSGATHWRPLPAASQGQEGGTNG